MVRLLFVLNTGTSAVVYVVHLRNAFCDQHFELGERMVFFFLFGGVTQEVQTVLKREAAVCPICKSPAALVEYDNVLRLFLIPVWKWSGENPAIKCTSCPFLMPLDRFNNRREAGKVTGPGDQTSNLQCWSCLAPVESANFKFCPRCGASL